MRGAAGRLGRLARDAGVLKCPEPQTKRNPVPGFSLARAKIIMRLARDACVLGVIGLAGSAASGAGAAPAPQVFALTIRATTVASIDHTDVPIPSGECTTTNRAEGPLTVHFGTRSPVLVRFVGGRLQPVTVAPLDGTAVLTGTNLLEEKCAAELPTWSTEYCRKTTRTFRGAKTTLRATRSGGIAVGPVRVRLRPIACPREPNELRQAILAPTPGPLRVRPRLRFTRITLTASARRTKIYGSPENGILQQRTAWSFTFVRTDR